MPIVPDDKDWTWVLDRPCAECGFDASTFPRQQVAAMTRANAQSWASVLTDAPEVLRRRPAEDRWSPLEYACHVRDVFTLYEQRLSIMLEESDPSYPNWDQDVTAVEQRYNEHDPATVAAQLVEAADRLAARFENVDGPAWERTGRRSDGASFTVATFARYMIHDPVHHLHDVTGRGG